MANGEPVSEMDIGTEEVGVVQSITEVFDKAGVSYSADSLLDDGGNRVEVDCVCSVKSTADVAKIVAIAKEMDYGEFILYMEGWLVSTIAEKNHEPAIVIRENIVEKFSSYFLPKSLRDDDVTFAVIKKR
ncbi:MAG: hypothetical protein AABX24_04025 [Nanoarchaeota archaeon]